MPSLVAGSLRLSYWSFALGVAISSLAYDVVLVVLGWLARIGLHDVSMDLRVSLIVGLVALVGAAWIILFFVFRRRANP